MFNRFQNILLPFPTTVLDSSFRLWRPYLRLITFTRFCKFRSCNNRNTPLWIFLKILEIIWGRILKVLKWEKRAFWYIFRSAIQFVCKEKYVKHWIAQKASYCSSYLIQNNGVCPSKIVRMRIQRVQVKYFFHPVVRSM